MGPFFFLLSKLSYFHAHFIRFFFTFASIAENEFLHEKTWPRDNTFCRINGKRLELQIKGVNKNTDIREKTFGEYVFYKINNEKYLLLPINKDQMDAYEFFRGTSPLCSKAHGYIVSDNTFVFLFSRENKPFTGKLTLQLFDSKTLCPKDTIDSSFLTDHAEAFKKGFAFPSLNEKLDTESGKVTINQIEYQYQNMGLVPWVYYSKEGFDYAPQLTYQKSEWKEYFKTEKEFLDSFAWNATLKKFDHMSLYLAFNHKERKKCILPIKESQQLTGTEKWICI